MSLRIRIEIFTSKVDDFIKKLKLLKSSDESHHHEDGAFKDSATGVILRLLGILPINSKNIDVIKARKTIKAIHRDFEVEIASLEPVIDHIMEDLWGKEKDAHICYGENLDTERIRYLQLIAEAQSGEGKNAACEAKIFKMSQTLEKIVKQESNCVNSASIIYLQLFLRISEIIILMEKEFCEQISSKLIDEAVEKFSDITKLYKNLYDEWEKCKDKCDV